VWVLLAGCAKAPDRPPNILLVSIDTVRADHLSTFGYGRDTSPNLTKMAARGTAFDAAFSQGNESLYSHASILTGRYPSEIARPVYAEYGLPGTALLLPEILDLYGYDTAAFTSGGHVIEAFGFSQGFDTFETSPGLGFGSFYDTVPMALKWIDTRTSVTPWFVFLHSYDAHAPYVRPDPFYHLYDAEHATDRVDAMVEDPLGVELIAGKTWYRDRQPQDIRHVNGRPVLATSTYTSLGTPLPGERVEVFTDAEMEHIRAHYDDGLAYADLYLGYLLAELQSRRVLQHTLVIVLSDHGEDLAEHGWFNHRTALADSTTHVPLVVMGPGFSAGARFPGLVDARDVVPTALRAAGAVVPAGLGGRALQDVVTGKAPALDAVFEEGVMDMVSVRTPEWRLVYPNVPLATPSYADQMAAAPIDAAHFVLYDLAADPHEQTNVVNLHADIAGRLRDRLVAWRRSLTPGTFRLGVDDVSPEVREMLRSRGYWDPRG
jgi:arylsulfatase A-like enzyme